MARYPLITFIHYTILPFHLYRNHPMVQIAVKQRRFVLDRMDVVQKRIEVLHFELRLVK